MITALLVICLFPVWGRLLPGSGGSVTEENRVLSPFPGSETPLSQWPAALERWFEDRLAFRREAISFAFHFNLADITQAAEGTDGWMYYLGDGSKDDMLRRAVLSLSEQDTLQAAQAETAARLAKAGAVYLVLICPDKQTIYPEYLPRTFQNVSGASRLDQLLPLLKAVPGVNVVDTREALLSAKGAKPLYFRTDTHWNDLGAWIACRASFPLLSKLLPAFRAVRDEEVSIGESTPAGSGDLARMLQKEGSPDYNVEVALSGFSGSSRTVPDSGTGNRVTVVYENPDHPELPRAVMFIDSFGDRLRPFLPACFSRMVIVWSDHVRMDIVEEEHPDIVIQEYVERLCASGLAKPAE